MALTLLSAFPSQSVTITLESDIDQVWRHAGRKQPTQSLQEIDAQLVGWGWSWNPGVRWASCARYHGSEVHDPEVLYKVDINTLHRNEGDKQVGMNDIARVRLRTASPYWRTTTADRNNRLIHPHRPGHEFDRRRRIHQLIAHDSLVHWPTGTANNPRESPLRTFEPKAPSLSWTEMTAH